MKIDRLLAHKAELRAQLNAELRFCRAKYRRWIGDVELQIKRLQEVQASESRSNPRRKVQTHAGLLEPAVSRSSRDANLLSLVGNILADLDNQPLTTHFLAQLIFEETGRRVAARRLGKPLSALAEAGEIVVLQRASSHQPTLYARFQRDAARRSFVSPNSAIPLDDFKYRSKRTILRRT